MTGHSCPVRSAFLMNSAAGLLGLPSQPSEWQGGFLLLHGRFMPVTQGPNLNRRATAPSSQSAQPTGEDRLKLPVTLTILPHYVVIYTIKDIPHIQLC